MILLIVSSSSCNKSVPRRNITFTDVFDTVSEFIAYGQDEVTFDTAANAVHEELLRLHRLCDPYHAYDDMVNLYSLNHRGQEDSFLVEDDLTELLLTGKSFYDETNGAFNIALGGVVELWHGTLAEEGPLPEQDAIRNALAHTDLDTVTIDGKRVTFTDPFLTLDLGAMAKGFAAEKAAKIADRYGFDGYTLNLGGNILIRGKKPEGSWNVGVQDPDGGIFTVVHLSACSAVTSGDYQRYRMIEGVRYHHILDASTGYPAEGCRSVTVLCQNSFYADILSTSLFCLDPDTGKILASKYGSDALWIMSDGTVIRTEGFADYE